MSGVVAESLKRSEGANPLPAPPARGAVVREYQCSATDAEEDEDFVPELDEFLEAIYQQVEGGEVRPAIVSTIDYVDRLLSGSPLSVCDQLLAKVEYERLPSSVRRAFLAVTYPARSELPAREIAYRRSLELLTRERGAETAKRMLRTLA